jgi:oligogalacturonide lyase
MKKGARFPAEGAWYTDGATGRRVRQVTAHPSINHPTYFLHSAFLAEDREMFFTSYRTGPPQLFRTAYPEGEIVQMTADAPVHPFSAALLPQSEEIVFTRGGEVWAIRLKDIEERLIFRLPAGQLGECSMTPDGKWLTAAYQSEGQRGLVMGRVDGRGWNRMTFPRTVIHPQFHPLEPEWIEFAADPAPRMYRVRRDGTGLECLYEHGNDEFVVHETFLGVTGDLVFTVWPHRLSLMDWTTRAIKTIAEYNAWHIAPNRAGTAVLCDTNHPDEGLQIIDVATGARRPVCASHASSQGSQWHKSRYALAEDFAAARSEAKSGRVLSWMETATDTVYGPQWTHPHPSWSRDESKIAFASDRTGSTQVYVVEL